MHIITRKRLNEFSEKYPDVKSALQHWYKQAKTNEFKSFAELRKTFGGTDQVGNLTVFNIQGTFDSCHPLQSAYHLYPRSADPPRVR